MSLLENVIDCEISPKEYEIINKFGYKCNQIVYIPENKEQIDEIVEEYIDFYINKRISLSLNGLTPKQYYDKYINERKRLSLKAS